MDLSLLLQRCAVVELVSICVDCSTRRNYIYERLGVVCYVIDMFQWNVDCNVTVSFTFLLHNS